MYKVIIEIDEPYETELRPEGLSNFEKDLQVLISDYANSSSLIKSYNLVISDDKKK